MIIKKIDDTRIDHIDDLLRNAFAELNLTEVAIIRQLTGGKTGALVFIADFIADKAKELYQLSGRYILKVDVIQRQWAEATESERVKVIEETAGAENFVKKFIPKLHFSKEVNDHIIMVYDIAGLSEIGLTAYDHITGPLYMEGCRLVSDCILSELNGQYSIKVGVSGRSILDNWLGYRLNRSEAPKLWEFIDDQTSGREAFFKAGRPYVNPGSLCSEDVLQSQNVWTQFSGLLHGDLHKGNVLFNGLTSKQKEFWVIDWALSRSGPLFYDQAYFEVSLLVEHLAAKPLEQFASLLEQLDKGDSDTQTLMIPLDLVPVSQSLYAMRESMNSWQKTHEERRRDQFVFQVLLARIAAGLNWVNKPIDSNSRNISFIYAAHAATQLMSIYYGAESKRMISTLETPNAFDRTAESESDQEDLWTRAWQNVSGFNDHQYSFLLVAGRIESPATSSALGFLPWLAIIDLDPNSETGGLFENVSGILKNRRSITHFGKNIRQLNFDKGTAWMMAWGWPDHAEEVPQTIEKWRREYLAKIQILATEIRKATAPKVLKVVLIPTNDIPIEVLLRIAERLDEVLEDAVEFVLIDNSDSDLSQNSLIKYHLKISAEVFLARVHEMYGSDPAKMSIQIPSSAGPLEIPTDVLRGWEEDFEVLHSKVLENDINNQSAENDFFRGVAASWSDLYLNRDIARDISTSLMERIRGKFQDERSFSLELLHSPGAGGTTVARRVAWTLRNERPVVLLTHFGKLTADRLDSIYHRSQLPILVIAEASDLSPTAREELLHALNRRNARIGLLYVVRATSRKKGAEFELIDPMESEGEVNRFVDSYLPLCISSDQKKQIKKIGNTADPSLAVYRSPFFFGLTTFETNFLRIDQYVKAHLASVTEGNRSLILYTALTTRFSQKGLSEGFIRRLAYAREGVKTNLEEIFGIEPAKLLVLANMRLKFVHPLLAEQAFRELLMGKIEHWKENLLPLCLRLISDTVSILGGDSNEARELFTQLFITRDSWVDNGNYGRPKFSALIETIPSIESQQLLLQRLTEVSPDEPHYWNHRGRHLIYRTKGNFKDAEDFLLKAVALSQEKDALHYHALGMVRRIWAKNILDELFRQRAVKGGDLLTAEKILMAVEEIVVKALDAFSRARELNPEDPHGYITPIQTILMVAERLTQVSHLPLSKLVMAGDFVAQWLQQYIAEAESLLTRVRHFRGHFDQSTHEERCEFKLSRLYGDFDDLISTWEQTVNSSAGHSWLRRALAGAYLARGKRSFAELRPEDLGRIVELIEENLDHDSTDEADLRTWFQAYRYLPDFSYNYAISRLQSWANRSESVDAHYYLYILHFLRWASGFEQNQELILRHLDKCRQLSVGRRDYSYEWFSLSPPSCPIVNSRDLGGWNYQSNFFNERSKLGTLTGTVSSIERTGGYIRLGNQLQAFFIPSGKIRVSEHLEARVKFVLGFSYERLRAWLVEIDSGIPKGS